MSFLECSALASLIARGNAHPVYGSKCLRHLSIDNLNTLLALHLTHLVPSLEVISNQKINRNVPRNIFPLRNSHKVCFELRASVSADSENSLQMASTSAKKAQPKAGSLSTGVYYIAYNLSSAILDCCIGGAKQARGSPSGAEQGLRVSDNPSVL